MNTRLLAVVAALLGLMWAEPARAQSTPPVEANSIHVPRLFPKGGRYPLTLGVKGGVLVGDAGMRWQAGVWLGLRRRPKGLPVSWFYSLGVEALAMGTPVDFSGSAERAGAFGALAVAGRAGFDLGLTGIGVAPLGSVYVVGAAMRGPTSEFTRGFRLGVGVSFTPLACLLLPTTLEISQDMYGRPGEPAQDYTNVQVGWMF